MQADRDLLLLGLFRNAATAPALLRGRGRTPLGGRLTDGAPAYATAADVSPVADAAGADAALPVLTLARTG